MSTQSTSKPGHWPAKFKSMAGVWKQQSPVSNTDNTNSNPTKKPNFTFNVNIQKNISSACPKWVLNSYESPCLFNKWSETQVEAAALWSVGFSMYLYIYNSNLFSLLSHFDFLYLSLKGLLQPLCLLLSEITFLLLLLLLFSKIRQYFSRECC